jgi:Family of unknown function (DUF6338)
MPSTLQAVIVTALAVLPGALYTWSFEQHAGRWGVTTGDRIQRFLGVSAFFVVAELPVLYGLVYRKFVVSGDIAHGRPLPIWVWILPIGFIVLPVTAGQVIGRAAGRRSGWARLLTGPSPAPRAWDELFATPDLTGWIRLRLCDGTWVCGLWGPSEATGLRSYASGYPEAQDLLIAEIAETDDDGEFLTGDGGLVLTGRSLLVGWAAVTYAEFIPG